MVDVQLFAQSEKVEEALRNHSCKECLQWCSENRSSLKKQDVRQKSGVENNVYIYTIYTCKLIIIAMGNV